MKNILSTKQKSLTVLVSVFASVSLVAISVFAATTIGTNITTTGETRFSELVANGTEYVGLKAPSSIGTSLVWTLPSADGTANQTLVTNGSGVLSWASGLTTALTSGNIFVGNGSNVATSTAMSGDATLSNAGALTVANSAVIGKVLTGYASGAGTVAATDTILQSINKLNGNDATNANLTGMVTSVGNAATVVTNANLTGNVTSVGNATTIAVLPAISGAALTGLTATNISAGTAGISITGNAATVTNGVYTTNKDVTGGVAGLTLFKINFKNAADTFTNFLTNATTAARTYTFQDRDGTIADNTDLALKANIASPTFTGTVTVPTPFTIGSVSMTATGTELNYVAGVSSAIQTQFTGKQGTLTNSAGLLAALNDETGTGLSVFSTSPTLTTPALGVATATSVAIGGGTVITKHLSTSAAIDIASIATVVCANTAFTVTGAAAGDIAVATPTPVTSGIETLNLTWNAYVSAANTVQVRVCNPTAGALDPASQTWRVDVWQH